MNRKKQLTPDQNSDEWSPRSAKHRTAIDVAGDYPRFAAMILRHRTEGLRTRGPCPLPHSASAVNANRMRNEITPLNMGWLHAKVNIQTQWQEHNPFASLKNLPRNRQADENIMQPAHAVIREPDVLTPSDQHVQHPAGDQAAGGRKIDEGK